LAITSIAGVLGMDIHLENVPSSIELSDTRILYSESAGRLILTVDPKKKDQFEKIYTGMKVGLIGTVSESPLFRVTNSRGETLIEEDVMQLKACWEKPFGGLV
jgi:phosphoribosylformylglycinamidine synthase